jgi:hypothetical protein
VMPSRMLPRMPIFIFGLYHPQPIDHHELPRVSRRTCELSRKEVRTGRARQARLKKLVELIREYDTGRDESQHDGGNGHDGSGRAIA